MNHAGLHEHVIEFLDSNLFHQIWLPSHTVRYNITDRELTIQFRRMLPS